MVSSPLLAGIDGSFFLETEVGQPYVDVFQAIRLQHILNEVVSTGTLEADRIIPECELHLPSFMQVSSWLSFSFKFCHCDNPCTVTRDEWICTSLFFHTPVLLNTSISFLHLPPSFTPLPPSPPPSFTSPPLPSLPPLPPLPSLPPCFTSPSSLLHLPSPPSLLPSPSLPPSFLHLPSLPPSLLPSPPLPSPPLPSPPLPSPPLPSPPLPSPPLPSPPLPSLLPSPPLPSFPPSFTSPPPPPPFSPSFTSFLLYNLQFVFVSLCMRPIFHSLVTAWLLPLYRKQWLAMLMVDQRLDPG